ncbi:FecCD family ABC transporter permease [Velocimicrobium porci]|uniref:Iron ABC transporter permease n=1 Tax=Velocimicrobium porci TaxID=2606634 RepID=A0A6L5XZ65_9FIRM|nr:iron ABC transporter permease [Velocimicrobium porci]MSS64140.1 iron ABC transporter permease [Velocimicrobium porci]
MCVKEEKETAVVKTSVYSITLVGLFIGLLATVLAAVTFGNADISLKQVYSVIGYELFHMEQFSDYASGAVHDVVWLIRFPRVILGMAVGMGLAVCGVVMQAVVKNPLADPYILGVSSGASLGATLAILLGFGAMFGSNSVGVMAFIGAVATSFAVLFISNLGGRANAGKLILAGMAISSVCSAFSSFLLYIENDKNGIEAVTYWTMGSLGGAKWENVIVIVPIIFVGTIIFWTQFRNLNLLLLGDEVSITLGTDLHKIRLIYMMLASFMVGFAVYCAGMIGFVGLIIPHAVRMLFGTDHKRLIPLCALLGAIFLMWSDVICRIILRNAEMPIGIFVSLIGAPCFIYLMIHKSYGFGGTK